MQGGDDRVGVQFRLKIDLILQNVFQREIPVKSWLLFLP
jgi:hypothetical protein